LAAAAIWHVTFVLAVFVIGRAQLAPQTFDRNGIGLSFAIDARSYRIEAEKMAGQIRQARARDWAAYKASFHVKIYSLSFALVGGLVGENILAAEPLNLLYYLLMLALAYAIASEAFDQKVGLLAASVVALWPSLLLHTTQLLRDALFIPSMLLLTLALVLIVNRNLSLKHGLVVAAAGGVGVLMVWLCRGDSWEMVLATSMFGAAICVLVQVRNRRFLMGNTLAIVLVIVLTVCIPRLVPAYRQSNTQLASTTKEVKLNGNATLRQGHTPQSSSSWDVAMRLGLLRHQFIALYPLAGSNLDTDVELRDTAAVVRYGPRAALIGFFAPFPNMWFAHGAQVGLAGRLISGAEMLLLYAVIALAGLTLVKQRRFLSVWLLFGIAAGGCTALGYVVVNISTLYRMRYAYFILIIILGMKGLLSVMPRRSEPQVELLGSAALE
jgi:hypothetical protein